MPRVATGSCCQERPRTAMRTITTPFARGGRAWQTRGEKSTSPTRPWRCSCRRRSIPPWPVGPQKEMVFSVVTTVAFSTPRDSERRREPRGGLRMGCGLRGGPAGLTTAAPRPIPRPRARGCGDRAQSRRSPGTAAHPTRHARGPHWGRGDAHPDRACLHESPRSDRP